MASLGSLVVSLGMDTARFTSDAGKAARQMAKLTAEAGKIGAAIGTSIGVGLGVIGSLVKQSIDAADATSKLAMSLGMTTEEVSRLSYVADLAGASQEELATSVAKLARQAVDAAAGGKAAGETFAAMGIKVTDSNGAVKSSSALLGDVAEKFASYKDGAEKTALAQELFGKSGAKLIPFLNNGRDGMEALAKEADALGIVLTDSAGKAAEQFNDNLTRLQKAKEGLGLQIAQKLLPTLENLTNGIFKSANSAEVFGKAATVAATGVKLLLSAGAIIIGVFKTLGEYIGGVGAALVALATGKFSEAFNIMKMTAVDFTGNMKGTIGTVGAIWDESAGKIEGNAPKTGGKIAAPLVVAAGKAAKAAKAIKDSAQKAYEDVEKSVSGILRELQTFSMTDSEVKLFDLSAAGATPEQFERARQYLEVLDKQKVAQDALKDSMDAAKKTQEDGKTLYEQTRTPIEELNKKLLEYQMLLDKGAISWDTFGRASDAAQDAFENAGKQIEKGKSLADELGLSFTSAFEDAIVGGAKFSDVISGLEQDTMRIITRKLVTEPLGNAISGLFSGGGGVGGLVQSGLSALSGLFPGFSMGTPYIPKDQLAMVHKGERVVTAADNASGNYPGGKGGMTNNMNFIISGPVDKRTQLNIAAAAQRGLQASARNL